MREAAAAVALREKNVEAREKAVTRDETRLRGELRSFAEQMSRQASAFLKKLKD